MPDDQSVISKIAARYTHDTGVPKTIQIQPDQSSLESAKMGFQAFNNTAMQ